MAFIQSRWLRFALLLGACAALLTGSAPAFAGTLQLKDSQGLLSPGDAAALHREGEALPFDARVVTTGDHPEKAELERYVHEQLTSPNMVVVGIDKAHRHTAVHFGTATGVPPSEYRAIEQAGNNAFRDGNWRIGISAILAQTRDVARASGAVTAATTREGGPVGARSTASASTAMWGLLAVVVVAGLIVLVGVTLARRARAGMLGQSPGGPNAPYPPATPGAFAPGTPGAYPPGAYPPGQGYGYGPGYGAPGGIGSGMGRNIAAAGLGGLVGYELGKMAGDHGDRREVSQEGAFTGGGDSRNDDRDPDAGGASGGWDDTASSGDSDWGGSDDGGGDFGGGDGGGSDW